MKNVKIYVVAWEYNDGAGFDWYVDKSLAIKKYREELKNEKIFSKDSWKAYLLTYDLSDLSDNITDGLDSILWMDIKRGN